MMQDPKMMAMMGQNPMAQQMQGSIMAHVAEHLAFAYRVQVEEQLGVPLPAPDAEMPEEIEVQLSRVVAQAAQQLLGTNKQAAQAQQAQQQAQDPMLQLQQQTLQIQAEDVKRKAAEDQNSFAIAKAKLALEQQRMQLDAQKETARLQAQTQQGNMKANLQNQQADKKLRVEMAKTMAKTK